MQGLKGKCAKSAIARDLRIGAARKFAVWMPVQSKKIGVLVCQRGLSRDKFAGSGSLPAVTPSAVSGR